MPDAALLNLPNVISLSRIVLAVAFVAMPDPRARVTLIVLAAISDFLDGWLARHSGSASRWGALIDPIADRAFASAIAEYCARERIDVAHSIDELESGSPFRHDAQPRRIDPPEGDEG